MPESEDVRKRDQDHVRKAAAIRGARYSLGISQVDMAASIGLPKTPLARFETLVAPLKKGSYEAIVDVLKDQGVTIDIGTDHVDIHLNQTALDRMTDRLTTGKRRKPAD